MRKKSRSLINPWRLPIVVLLSLLALSHPVAFGAEPTIVVDVEKSGDAFLVNALLDVQVPLDVAWGVFVDIDHMTDFLENMTFSKVMSRTGNVLIARQDGVARFGPFSFSFVSEREIRLDPMRRIATRNVSGTLKRMQSEARFVAADQGVRISYSAEIVPDSLLAQLFGQSIVRHEVNEQFLSMTKEMLRRYAVATGAGNSSAMPAAAAGN